MTAQRIYRFAMLACLLTPDDSRAQSSETIDLLIRVFDGVEEVTEHCRIAVYAADTREKHYTPNLDSSTGHLIRVEPGLYDLRIGRRESGDAIKVEWIEHVTVLGYPDEGKHHIEIINLQAAFGALLIRPPDRWVKTEREWRVSAFLHDNVGNAGFAPVDGPNPNLFILPAGSYDLVAHFDSTEITVTDVEVPARGTRLKLLE